MKNFIFFEKRILTNKYGNEKMMAEILKHLEFIYMNENEIIWNVGDKVNEMYIIFLGEINIYRQPNKEEKQEIDNTLEKGYSLGEEFLKANIFRRRYMAKTKTFSILGKLSSKDYNRIFNRMLYEETILINSFLKELKIFSYDFIERFQKNVVINYYNKNEYIFRQNEPFKTFYFIFSGTVRLIVNLNKSVKSKINHDILIGKNNNRFTASRLFEIRGFYKELINYNLVDMTSGDILGGIEYCNKYDNYKYDVKCLTNVEIFKIDLIHFNNILIKEEMEIFNKKIKNQYELISQRIQKIKEERQKIKINDYILSKNKFTKTFLLNNPLSKKNECKTELYINSSSNPFKIKHNKYNKKKMRNTKIFLNSIEDYKAENNNMKTKSSKNIIEVKDFFTNIDYKHKVPVAEIFPKYLSIDNISNNSHKKIFFINKNRNKKNIKKNNKIFKNKTIASLSSYFDLKNKNKTKNMKLKSNSHKVFYKKYINKNEIKNKFLFNIQNIKEKMNLNKNKKNAKSHFFTSFNSFSGNKKIINNN